MDRSYTGWAIRVKTNDGLAGRYWWFGGRQPNVPPQFEGHIIAVFPTRQAARLAAAGIGTPVRVSVSVKVIE